MKAQITITWNPNKGEETTVSFSEGWNNLLNIEKADCLEDALCELTDKYSKLVEAG